MSETLPVRSDEPESPASGPLEFQPVTAGVSRLRVVFVNLYAVEAGDGSFVLVDTGIPGMAALVLHAVAKKFGPMAKPTAIVLTHAHFDHAGGAQALAAAYDVPVYVHELERPYVTGKSDYPPADPTPGGAIAFLSRAFPTSSIDLGKRVKTLPSSGTVPGLPSWRWIHTPGHTVGHVSLWREEDRTLLVGDAFATADLDNWVAVNTWPKELARSPLPFVPDWPSAMASVHALADLRPRVAAAGHGLPIEGDDLAPKLRVFANRMGPPPNGRYTKESVTYAADGSVETVPPPKPDPLPKKLAVAGVALLAAMVLLRRRDD